jgi:hypothetical protein
LHEECAQLIADYNVRAPVSIHVSHVANKDLRAHTRFVIDQIRNKIYSFIGANSLEPVEYRWAIWIYISVGPVCPVPLAGDNIRNAVPIYIGDDHRMEFGERDAIPIRVIRVAHDDVLAE